MSAIIPDAGAQRLDIYKAYLADVGNIGSRHADTNKFYVSLLSAILVVMGLTGKDGPFKDYALLQQAVAFLAISVSVLWFVNIATYARLYRAKFGVLRSMEEQLPVRPFSDELRALGTYVHLTLIERLVAVVVTIPFIVLLQHLGVVWVIVLLVADGIFLVLMIAAAIPRRG